MNLSGESVREAAQFYKIPPEKIVVLFDDISLDVGRLRVRAKGSAGGQNGVKSIIYQLQSDQFPRVKIGIGSKPHPDYDLADWVLSKFQGDDLQKSTMPPNVPWQAAEEIVRDGAAAAAQKFNGAN